ncbi:hypothetical protein [Comamonas badia]|uniref:hypothetical protein n=1 Tax=Comamonas badia TaxID=265291 RepID=UPI0012EB2882|nr:hypothetical protein [Comamonas badia]
MLPSNDASAVLSAFAASSCARLAVAARGERKRAAMEKIGATLAEDCTDPLHRKTKTL